LKYRRKIGLPKDAKVKAMRKYERKKAVRGFSVRKRKDCRRFELRLHPTKKCPALYGGLYKTVEDAERIGRMICNDLTITRPSGL